MDPRFARSLRHGLLASTALAGALPAAAGQLPTGYATAYGSVGFHRASGTLTINQGSQAAIVDYNSFSIGRRNRVQIRQPDASAVMLNRVTGSTRTVIAGRLSANGQVYLINPNGIAITRTGAVKVGGGFVASSLGMSDDEFKGARRHLAGSGGTVANRGTITIGRGGYADLVGGRVTNGGTIAVPMGNVALGSGRMATLDVSGDGFLQVALPSTTGGKSALIEDTGRISGTTVLIDAATARAAARNAVNIAGAIDSHTISGRSGAIQIGGGEGGAVAVSGRLSVASRRGTGGTVTITGTQVALRHARVLAQGAAGGGTVQIGGGGHGEGPLQHATKVSIDPRSRIDADATVEGTGGAVTVWSDGTTAFAGTITARGGRQGGDGGSAEVSSAGTLAYDGVTVLTAPHGTMGTLLLDPENVTISAAADSNQAGFTATGDNSIINVTTLENALATANVTVSTGTTGTQAGTITVASPFGWSSGSLLTLAAADSIAIDAPITIGGAGSLALSTRTTTVGTTTQPLLSFGNGADITYAAGPAGTGIAGQALTINGTSYTLVRTMAQLQAIGLTGAYALAGDLAAAGTTYTNALVAPRSQPSNVPGYVGATGFTGTFEGLGHVISGLTIAQSYGGNATGLFGVVGAGGTVRDIGLVGANITSPGASVGALVDYNDGGTITQAYATGAITVTGSGDLSGSRIGGLVGLNDGTVTRSAASSTIAVSAVGDVSANAIGGLVGFNDTDGTIARSSATGAVTVVANGRGAGGQIGGLVGSNDGMITQSYATGALSVQALGSYSGGSIGGLVGYNAGTLAEAYATGPVIVDASGDAFAGQGTGGLVGYNTGSIAQAYATGAVIAIPSGNFSGYGVGGLVGYNTGSITQTYATSAVAVSDDYGGGLVGDNVRGTITLSTFDTQTTGESQGIGVDNNNQVVVGMTTAQLQGTAPTLDPFGPLSTFAGGAAGGEVGVYPYLTSFFPNGVQAVSGFAYKDGAGTLLTSTSGLTRATMSPGLVSAVAAGRVLGTATTGANGYYYVFSALGSVAPGAGVVAYTVADTAAQSSSSLGGSGAQNAASFTQSPGTAANTALDVYGTWRLDQPGSLTSVSTLDAAYATAVGATVPAGFVLANREIDAPGPFAFDSAVTASGTLAVSSPGAVTQTAAGAISVGSLRLAGTGTYTLEAANAVGAIAAEAGAVRVNDASSLQTGSVADAAGTAIAGVTTTGALTLTSDGAITIVAGAPIAGASPVLAATGAFVNADGATAVTASDGGRWLVYSSAPGADTFGGLDSGNTAIFDATYATLPPDRVAQAGDRYLFASQPALTVTTTNDSKIYGTDATAKVATDYVVTGFDPGVAGAYLGDTAATATTGMPSVTSAGAPATAPVGSYAITATPGSLASPSGYRIAVADDGTLVVDPRALTITADDQSRRAGQPNPPLTYQVGGMGLVDGDRLVGALTTTATLTSPRGTYPIRLGTLTAGRDYVITYVPGTLTVEGGSVAPPPVAVGVLSADLASTADRAYLQVVGPPVVGLPFLFSTAAGEGPIGAQIVQGLSDPRFDEVIVCVKEVCTLAAPRPRRPLRSIVLKTSALETSR